MMKKSRAIKLAIEALEYRRRLWAAGYNTYKRGYRDIWVVRDYKKYQDMTAAIEVLEEMKDV